MKVKSFVGTSMNAVRIQIWTALCVYLLVAFLQFRSRLGLSFWAILRKLRFILFERRELSDLFILPEKRGLGYGKALLKYLAKLAVESGQQQQASITQITSSVMDRVVTGSLERANRSVSL